MLCVALRTTPVWAPPITSRPLSLLLSLAMQPHSLGLCAAFLTDCCNAAIHQTVGVARPSDFDEHVAAASMFHRADELVVPVQKALRFVETALAVVILCCCCRCKYRNISVACNVFGFTSTLVYSSTV